LIRSNLFLILASGETNGIGYWLIDTTSNEYPIIENKDLLECFRKELIGEESAKKILYAINFNLSNLLNELKREGFKIEMPPKGIPFNLPLNLIENIFDFWLETYKNKTLWETSIGLLKIKKRLSLSNIIESQGIKHHVRELAFAIEKLHKYRPSSQEKYRKIDPMWR
tara:strand:+ start:568 stop:1071 length:504 start_codon:yes stop_codon:yes gene_type:complete